MKYCKAIKFRVLFFLTLFTGITYVVIPNFKGRIKKRQMWYNPSYLCKGNSKMCLKWSFTLDVIFIFFKSTHNF